VSQAVVSCPVCKVIQSLVVFAAISGNGKPVEKLADLGTGMRWAHGKRGSFWLGDRLI